MVTDVNAQDEENLAFEKENCELEDYVMNQEQYVKKKNLNPADEFIRKETIWK